MKNIHKTITMCYNDIGRDVYSKASEVQNERQGILFFFYTSDRLHTCTAARVNSFGSTDDNDPLVSFLKPVVFWCKGCRVLCTDEPYSCMSRRKLRKNI